MTHSSEVRLAAFVLLGNGCSARRVGALLGVSRSQVSQWRLDAGGVINDELRESPRYLSRADRYEIARLREHGLGCGRSRNGWVGLPRRCRGSCDATTPAKTGGAIG